MEKGKNHPSSPWEVGGKGAGASEEGAGEEAEPVASIGSSSSRNRAPGSEKGWKCVGGRSRNKIRPCGEHRQQQEQRQNQKLVRIRITTRIRIRMRIRIR